MGEKVRPTIKKKNLETEFSSISKVRDRILIWSLSYFFIVALTFSPALSSLLPQCLCHSWISCPSPPISLSDLFDLLARSLVSSPLFPVLPLPCSVVRPRGHGLRSRSRSHLGHDRAGLRSREVVVVRGHGRVRSRLREVTVVRGCVRS